MSAVSGWYRDPSKHHLWRWWNGAAWDRWVDDGWGELSEDPVSGLSPPRIGLRRKRIIRAAALVVAGIALVGVGTVIFAVFSEPHEGLFDWNLDAWEVAGGVIAMLGYLVLLGGIFVAIYELLFRRSDEGPRGAPAPPGAKHLAE